MATITPATLQALQTSVSFIFQSAYRDYAEQLSGLVSTEVPSSTQTNTYAWMLRLLSMRQWNGPRVIQNLQSKVHAVSNRDFEATVGCDRNEIEDDQLGVFSLNMQMLGRSAARLRGELCREAIVNNAVGFDGVPYFAANHPLNPAGVQSNTSALALTQTNLAAVKALMMSFAGEDGKPLGVRPNLVVVPSSLELTIKTILVAEYGANGASNVSRGDMQYYVDPELVDQNDWYVFDTTAPVKPVIFQNRKSPQLVQRTSPDDDNVFSQRQFIWGVDARAEAFLSLWWLGYKATQ
jgi:phage major head subunit gpT-like protein